MKKLFLLIISILCGCSILCAQTADQKIYDLINANDYIGLKQQYPLLKDSVKTLLAKDMAETSLDLIYGGPAKAAASLNNLLQNHSQEMGDVAIVYAMSLADQLYQMGEYRSAASIAKQAVDQSGHMDRDTQETLKSYYRQYRGLCTVSKPEIIRKTNISNKVKMQTAPKVAKDFWYVPACVNGLNTAFIFDTGANYNMVSKTFAQKHHIRPVADSVLLAGLNNTVYGEMGVIDCLKIGNIEYRNAVTYIVEDSCILPPSIVQKIGYNLDAVIGQPFMKAVGKIKIMPKESTMELMEARQGNEQPNMMSPQNQFYVEAFSNGRRLLLGCDTGGKWEIGLSEKCYQAYSDYFKIDHSQTRKGGETGVGGNMHVTNLYVLSEFPLTIGNKTLSMKKSTLSRNNGYPHSGYLGIDFFKLCNEVVFDFKNMILTLK